MSIIKEILQRNIGLEEDMNIFIGDSISDKRIRNAKKKYGLDINDEIYYMYDITLFGTGTEGAIFTDYGIKYKEFFESVESISWTEIEKVEYKPIDKKILVYTTYSHCYELNETVFSSKKFTPQIVEVINEIAEHHEDNYQNMINQISSMKEEILSVHSEKKQIDKAQEILRIIENYLNEHSGKMDCDLFQYKAWAYNQIGDTKNALEFIKKAIKEFYAELTFPEDTDKWFYDQKECFSEILKIKAEILENIADTLDNPEEKGQYLLEIVKDYSQVKKLKKEVDESTKVIQEIEHLLKVSLSRLTENLTSIDYQKRQVILVDDMVQGSISDNFLPMIQNQLEKACKKGSLKFQIGHPRKHELYFGHPYKPNVYFPLNDYKNALFVDKGMELNYFLQCLGATKIEIINVEGTSFEEMQRMGTNQSMSAGLGKKVGNQKITIHSIENSKSNEFSENQSQKSEKSMNTILEFSPKEAPHLPDDLIWYPHETLWQRIAQQRLKGGLLNASIQISTNDLAFIDEQSKNSLIADVETYLVQSGVSFDKERYYSSSQSQSSVLQINVVFAPESEFSSQITSSDESSSNVEFTSNEVKYLEELELMLEDDAKIDADERKILERKRIKLDISEERAKELEVSLQIKSTALNDSENEYLEEIKEIIEDEGSINESTRKVLERRRVKLGISEERAKELESLFVRN